MNDWGEICADVSRLEAGEELLRTFPSHNDAKKFRDGLRQAFYARHWYGVYRTQVKESTVVVAKISPALKTGTETYGPGVLVTLVSATRSPEPPKGE